MVDFSLRKAGFDKLLFKRLWGMLPIMFPHCLARTSLLFVLLLVLGIVGEFLAYNVGVMPSKFYAVLGRKDKSGFYSAFLEATLYIVGISIVLSAKQYVASILYLCWRKLLTKRLHHLYFTDKSYYALNVLGSAVDNPDQRITQDVHKMVDKLSNIVPTLLMAPFKIGYYSYLSFVTTTYIGPLSIFAYFILGTIVSKLLMSPVINGVVKQEKREGDFRFKHMQVRSNAEALAFHDCSVIEEKRLDAKLYALLATQMVLANLRLGLNFFLNCYNYFGGTLSNLIISIPIFAGTYDNLEPTDLAALISQNAFVSIYLISSFTTLVDLSSQVTEIAGTAHRVGQILEELSPDRKNLEKEVLNIRSDEDSDGDSRPTLDQKYLFKLSDVSVVTPNANPVTLIKGLTFEIAENDRILIMGPSSSGKSSLMRVLADLWPPRHGLVQRSFTHPVQPSDALFLPQRPYFTDGSLWQQIVFPLEASRFLDDCEREKALESLRRAGAEKIAERVTTLDAKVSWNWYDVLSPGEMQRLAFARLFYHRPRIVFLDEATSAVSMQVEEELYGNCLDLGITFVSVGHRPTLRKYHNALMELDGKGGWYLRKLADDTKEN